MFTTLQSSFGAGEISPSLWGRTDLAKWHQGSSTYRNFFASYRGGAASRAGFAYVGMCKQAAPNIGGTADAVSPPRDIKFQFNINQGYALEFGDFYMRIKFRGAYVLENALTIAGATQADPAVLQIVGHGLSVGDWAFISGMQGMTNFNGLTWVVNTVPDADHITLQDLFGNIVSSTSFNAYAGSGTVSRIYTVASPYAAMDLPWLKFTQSADTMTLACVNQTTGTEYISYELQRNAQTNWTFTADDFGSNINPPTNIAVTATSSTTVTTYYSYIVTAVSATGEESVASVVATVENNDISVNAGSNTITWNAVAGATSYNIYGSTPSYQVPVPIGSSFGFLGTSFGGSFVDTNIVADFATVAPTHTDPFARGAIDSVTVTAQGSGYTQGTVGYSIVTSTGSGFAGSPVVVDGKFVAFIVDNGGELYADTDTIVISDSGSGTGAAATLVVGPQTGTYPSTVAYYQQRRAYAGTLNNPDTYYMSQPGAYNNMDSSIPTTDSDAIIGTPWGQQINGIQFLQAMPGGLVILSGNGAWQLSGGSNAALTPSDQDASPQAYNGCNDIVPPITINYDILYLQAKGSIVRDLSYNFFVNIYTGTDQTVLSNQLFQNHTLLQWAYAEEPYKLVWCIRDDGIMLCFTYLKEQDIYAWTRHDTNGLFVGICSATEPPVDAVYVIVKRFVNNKWVYYSERMDDRLWQNVEDTWCVDAGLSYPMSEPNATLTPTAAFGDNNISGAFVVIGGSGYASPIVEAVDATGAGTGATFQAVVSGGAIIAIIPITQGQNYIRGRTSLVITDPTGTGALANPIITNNAVFNASADVFTPGMVGDVIRVDGGKATITAVNTTRQVVADITQPLTATIPNDPNNTPVQAAMGQWTLSTPTSSVSGLNHLEGLQVSILADGSVVAPQTVSNGMVTLPAPASQILVGLPYVCQLQTLFLDVPSPDGPMAGKRSNVQAASVRVEQSRGWTMGTNKPDASAQPNYANVPWTGMKDVKERNALVGAGSEIPLFTGNVPRQLLPGDWTVKSQLAFQQTNPLPLNVLSTTILFSLGDSPNG